MNQIEIFKKVRDYIIENNISHVNLYTGHYSMTEYTDDLMIDDLSAALVGGNFLRKKELIEPILPFVRLKESKHLLAILSTYGYYLKENKPILLDLIKNNKEFLQSFSKDNREIYFYSKSFLAEQFSEVGDVFKDILIKNEVLIKKKPSYTYSIDMNAVIEVVNIKSFTWIESRLKSILDCLQNNKNLNNYLQIENSSFYENNDMTMVIVFVGGDNEQLIDKFMNNLINNYITSENKGLKGNAEDMKKIVDFTLLQQQMNDVQVNKKVTRGKL